MFESLSGRVRIINYLLAISITIAILFLTRNIINLLTINAVSSITDTADTMNKEKVLGKGDIDHYSVILEKNPFGKPMKLKPLVGTHEGVEKVGASSDLILVGTAIGSRGMSYAIFEWRDGKGQEVFRIGEDVLNYGRLSQIGSDHVSLIQGNDTVTIRMIEIDSVMETPQSNAGDTARTFVRKVGEREYLINRERVEQSLQNPEQLLTDARLLPNLQDGKQEGFKVLEVKPGGLYESLGLRNGDILLRINGIDISSPDVAIQAMSALRGMNKINLDIMRDGNRLSMNYQIR
ncbi:MAG: type II secretion system protein GspC [Thermodesulfovibrionia bacterium]